ncbi:hypothetical protein [Staphylococcus simiae]|uniref:Uncharacterized protein n=1 Tax=Staphylococcus simiae CCM 7213 = CCUG 51256 TaxID=911238 RepID=G5JH91_9STAP|nr:hypothetical protein [Staphylococcus simiae]EHJ08439.1 hypothetical protein SS7213T_04100 [Staphylococcus simiae CCM 7213 = CCUG 51256]PNZ12544.1 hypothetical protein CD113_06525 [Staphylococcus simiae]SNV67391.1 Rho termination factor domain-containing protein [Staphylococcus simiae]
MAKKKFEVLHKFVDLEDKKKVYNIGDTYPKPANKKVSHERILELSTSDNKQGKVLIKEMNE